MSQLEPIPEGNSSLREYARQLSDGLLWINDRAWPLGGCLLFLSGLYLHQYIQVEKIPLSITSGAVITALPIMFAMMIFVIVVLSTNILLPTMVLFQRLDAKGRRLADQLEGKSRGAVSLAWLAGSLALALFLAFSGYFVIQIGPMDWYWLVLLPVGLIAVATFVGFIHWLVPTDLDKPERGEFYTIALCSAGLQLLVLLQVTAVVETLVGELAGSASTFLPIMALEVLVLVIVQVLMVAMMVHFHRQKNVFRPLMVSFTLLLMVVGLFPEAAAKIGGYALQVSGSGGRTCIVLNTEQGPTESMKILAEADGIYYARPITATTKELQLIRRDTVKGFDECAKPKPAQP
ncbi:hypothetical protein D3C81_886780 [compost metagenome]|uniref:Membrane protein n=1 Tax=Pseudomonas wadenswilerensis TaxID=1785161 RepID=A0A380T2V5_9PSED|nr:hypothetical protein [Pseudomonas wadenswilerensis]SUQ63846.1 Membrane protein [Pseudomonas wadenswilerensis]